MKLPLIGIVLEKKVDFTLTDIGCFGFSQRFNFNPYVFLRQG